MTFVRYILVHLKYIIVNVERVCRVCFFCISLTTSLFTMCGIIENTMTIGILLWTTYSNAKNYSYYTQFHFQSAIITAIITAWFCTNCSLLKITYILWLYILACTTVWRVQCSLEVCDQCYCACTWKKENVLDRAGSDLVASYWHRKVNGARAGFSLSEILLGIFILNSHIIKIK